MDPAGSWEAVPGNWLRDLAVAAVLLGSLSSRLISAQLSPFIPWYNLGTVFQLGASF